MKKAYKQEALAAVLLALVFGAKAAVTADPVYVAGVCLFLVAATTFCLLGRRGR